ncbi:hypothetical protein [Vallitalea maricola]|uniref:Uncharacterized protein n=1 Tax=Vallitalea maricola TaxID=3074433 RepID=A0ACB5UG11_9FIRM|nr:hypothetical protein AN2V17_07320 [Vallitalea sp. AN17-2]
MKKNFVKFFTIFLMILLLFVTFNLNKSYRKNTELYKLNIDSLILSLDYISYQFEIPIRNKRDMNIEEKAKIQAALGMLENSTIKQIKALNVNPQIYIIGKIFTEEYDFVGYIDIDSVEGKKLMNQVGVELNYVLNQLTEVKKNGYKAKQMNETIDNILNYPEWNEQVAKQIESYLK